MKAKTILKLKTAIHNYNTTFKNDSLDDFIKYVNDYVDKNYSGIQEVFEYDSALFGHIKVTIKLDNKKYYLINDGNYQNNTAQIQVYIETDFSDEDTFIDDFEKDNNLVRLIESHGITFISNFNKELESIKMPINENVIFAHENFYIEYSVNNAQHTVEFGSFFIDNIIDTHEMWFDLEVSKE